MIRPRQCRARRVLLLAGDVEREASHYQNAREKLNSP
jgi:hypothetical protein